MKIHIFLLVGVIFLLGPSLWAQSAADSTAIATQPVAAVSGGSWMPVEIRMDILVGPEYFLNGEELVADKDFEGLTASLRDYEATRLLQSSESLEQASWWLDGFGLAGLITGVVGILTSPSDKRTPFWITGAGGAALIEIGGLFDSQAKVDRFNCIQRYNRFARGEEQVLPQTPTDEKELLNFGNSPANSNAGPSAVKP